MALFPRIASPCPYLDRLDQVMDGDFCRMCRRTVHDLTRMDDAGRVAFMAACGGDACVSYTMRLSPAAAAAALAASAAVLVPASAMAQTHRPRVHHLRPPRIHQPPTIQMMTAGVPVPVMIEPVASPQKPADAKPSEPPVADRPPEPKRD